LRRRWVFTWRPSGATALWIVPVYARLVIDRQGVVAFAEAAFDYNERSEPADLVPLLANLQRRG
jgi:hypothetical protein